MLHLNLPVRYPHFGFRTLGVLLLLIATVSGAARRPAQAAYTAVTSFYTTSAFSYTLWTRGNHLSVPLSTSFFVSGTNAVGFFLSYQDADPGLTTAQIVIYDSIGLPITTGRMVPLVYESGTWADLFSGTFASGRYHATIFIDGARAATAYFTVGPLFPFLPSHSTPAAAACQASDVEGVVRCAEPSVLRVEGKTEMGSGFVVDVEGGSTYVVTNKHVVAGNTVASVQVLSPDGHTTYRVLGLCIGSAPELSPGDLAVIKVAATNLHALPWASPRVPTVGETVVSIGYSEGLSGPPSVTTGIISALHRDMDDGYGPVWLQHQSFINPGNSGGPLLTLQGQVVGINTWHEKDAQGMFFAIPAQTAQQEVGRLIASLH